MLFHRAPVSTLVGVPFSLLMCLGLLPYVDPTVAWTWFALRCGMAVTRLLMSHSFFRATAKDPAAWRRGFVAVLAMDGFVWGLVSIWLAPQGSPHVTALLLTSLVGVAAVGMFVLQSSWRASAAFLVSMLLPVALHQMVMGGHLGLFAGLGLLAFLAIPLSRRIAPKGAHASCWVCASAPTALPKSAPKHCAWRSARAA